MKKGLLILMVLALALPMVSAANSCKIEAFCSAGLAPIGYVSLDGHFSTTIVYPYKLCCPSSWIPGPGQTIFKFSATQTHVADNTNPDYTQQIIFPFTKTCQAVAGNCAVGDTCIFKMASPSNAHISDCTDPTKPTLNTYAFSLCCGGTEICNNGKDDDGDGFVDCSDSDCNEYGAPSGQPQICSGGINAQTTANCVIPNSYNKATGTTQYQPQCLGGPVPPTPANKNFYCSYGITDDSAVQPTGICCSASKRSFFDIPTGTWRCVDTEPCGIQATDECQYDFLDNYDQWIGVIYSPINPSKWCQSQTPNIMTPPPTETPNYYGSQACCLLPKHGEIGYYPDANNVKIYG